MSRPVIHLPGDPDVMVARSRLSAAKAAWTALAVAVLRREVGAAERVDGTLRELNNSHEALAALTHRGEDTEA